MQLMRGADRGEAIVAVLLAAVAAVMLWQSREFTRYASIFPRAVGLALLLCSLLVLLRIVRRKVTPAGALGREGLVRSGLLVLTLLLWISMLEIAGFFFASWVGFSMLALLANRDPMTARRLLGFAVVAFVCVLALQLLFQRGLDVRLPAGIWFPGVLG